MKPIFHYAALATAINLVLHSTAYAEQALTPFATQPSQSDFGGVGLIQMPSARMNKEGEFSVNYFDTDQYRRYSLSLQLFPWLESTVRYVDVRTRKYSDNPDFSGDQTLKDKGIDAKVRLLKESQWLPELSVGARDLGGTGLFASEFVAANKRFGPLDFTVGMGWGYLGSRDNISNPFCEASDRFCDRPQGTLGSGGKFDVNKMFRGPAALFGGVEYQTPWQPLRLKLEYDSNDYKNGNGNGKQEPALGQTVGGLPVDAPVNVGAVYRAFDWLDVHANYQRGNTFGFGVTMRTNFNELTPSWNDVSHPNYDAKQQPEAGQADWGRLQGDLAENAGYKRTRIYQDNSTLVVSGEQTKYRDRSEAQARAAVLLANQVPADIKQVQLIERKKNLDLSAQEFDMTKLRLAADNAYIGADVTDAMTAIEPKQYASATPLAEHKQRVRYGISPVLKQSLGGPESFYMYQVGFNANAEADISKQWLVSAGLYVNLLDNYDKWDENYNGYTDNTPALPQVRTLIRKYVSDNPVRLDNAQLTWMDRVTDDWYAQAYGGYLEMMYAGVGGEVLYRPANSKWALGANLNHVKQRDYDSQFGMLDYSVNTGHVSGYVEMPWLEDTLLQVHAGQYLAGDKGATFDISHKFDSGVIAGAFATFTDVSSDEFGEGSFNKGFYLSIPFDIMTVKPSTSRASISWVPLTRDGGQMVGRKYSLYNLTDARAPYYGL
ncbi:YjbH domain-containing protein [Oceanisphaera pacifica]|uniref:YjbH domain-containing protein n=1 Tax=Oceanisphaera pacifica TaxID=2818389 RepID=A0ABS3NEK7_9GAMM|nr:YjbH domain-containing protein [Oceanisphaera pacifica]MBO1518823.1 YjbH domain-containing protein [Oceanisphaera pacifica]